MSVSIPDAIHSRISLDDPSRRFDAETGHALSDLKSPLDGVSALELQKTLHRINGSKDSKIGIHEIFPKIKYYPGLNNYCVGL